MLSPGLRGEAACRYNQENGPHFSAEEIDRINRGTVVWHTREAIKYWDWRVLKNRTLYPNAPFLHQTPEAVQPRIISRYRNEGLASCTELEEGFSHDQDADFHAWKNNACIE